MSRCAVFMLGLGLGLAACGRAQGTPDEELGSLVLSPKVVVEKLDVARAATDVAELTRALDRPYREALAAGLPAGTVTVTTTTEISADGAIGGGSPPPLTIVDTRDDKSVLEAGDGDAFHGTYENSTDYGRETIFVDKQLYLRPRYQRWHGRAPEAADEPAKLRDAFVDGLGATWDLIAPAAALTDRGGVEVAGRPARAIDVGAAAQVAAVPDEPLVQKKWRVHRTITGVTGKIVLDVASGAPLSAELAGTIGFQREGKPMTMKVTAKLAWAAGKAAIAAPAKTEVVATPERLKEVDDRDYLLEGIAPPARTGSASLPP